MCPIAALCRLWTGSIGHPSQALLSHDGREGCARRGGTLASSAADAVRGDVPKRQMAPSCDVQRGKIRVRTGSFSACCLPVKPNSCYPALPTPFVPETCWAFFGGIRLCSSGACRFFAQRLTCRAGHACLILRWAPSIVLCWALFFFVPGKPCFSCWARPAVFHAGHGLAGRFLFCASCGPTAV